MDKWLKKSQPQDSHVTEECASSSKEPPTKKTRALEVENRKIKEEWEIEFFVTEKDSKPYCLLCNKTLAIGKKYNVKRHYDTTHAEMEKRFPPKSEQRKQELEKIKRQLNAQAERMRKFIGEGDMIQIATLRCSWILARRKKSFADAEMLKETLLAALEALTFDFTEKEREKLTKRVKMMPLSRQTTARRIVNLSQNIEDQLKKELNSCLSFSIALDESTDMRDTAQLCIWIRLVTKDFEVKEELLALSPINDRTRGCNILQAASKEFEKFGLNMQKLTSLATDGAPSMKGKNEGFSRLFQLKEKVCVPSFHCIIHQESLCCELFKSGELHEVMEEVIKIVNFIRARALNHRQFLGYLEEVEAEYGDLIYFNVVRWLSRGNVLKRFTELLPQIRDFLELKCSQRPNLSDPQWLTKLYFLTELTRHLNTLNLKLQGRNKSIADLYKEVQIFRLKLDMWIEQIALGDCTHFPLLNSPELSGVPDFKQLESYLLETKSQFQKRFKDFDEFSSCFDFLRLPLKCKPQDVSEFSRIGAINIAKFQEELIELKSNYVHQEDPVSLDFWRQIYKSQNYPETSTYVAKLWAMFGSTWLCESTFSFMKLLKSKLRATLSDVNLESELRCGLTEYTPEFSNIVQSANYQYSH
ncbi:general transcription factor II-I repeat domain-containing protein 2-like [Spea bombifrons]|uniref:general transcription factor II-I repeat domain-containing protein 2-like n=1 Tax=Spea bombifrons TaxID=233779 RepID=UPI00234BB5BC|nr:general transcription factor II-I repeat domain-containing protein 2-like [Spea bombifrons]